MNQGRIIGEARNGKSEIFGDFKIDFPTKSFGPYSYIFTRENLYYSEELGDRGSILFPLKDREFGNTEIFLERDDIVISCGIRGSFSGQEKLFVELVNLETQAKFRFYPSQVSLIYNTNNSIICCYRDDTTWKKSEFLLTDFTLISESEVHISAFFKLLYNHDEKKYYRLIYIGNGYFYEVEIQKKSNEELSPLYFMKEKFELTCKNQESKKIYIDVWKSSLTGEM